MLYPPPRAVSGVEVQHGTVTASAWTIEDQPLGVVRGSDDHGVPGGQLFGDVRGGGGGEIGFEATPL